MRVEFKTEPVNDKSLRGKLYREEYPSGEIFRKTQFENEQIRITRIVIPARAKLDVSANATEPALLIALTPAQFRVRGRKSKAAQVSLELGITHWLGINQQQQLENLGNGSMELLRFDFNFSTDAHKERSEVNALSRSDTSFEGDIFERADFDNATDNL